MGMFDSVWFDCPSCGARRTVEAQSKAGECILHDYDTTDVPPKVAADLGGKNAHCSRCNETFTVEAHICVMLTLR